MSQDGGELLRATDMETNSSTAITLKDHQIELFEKCKYRESKSGTSNANTDDCLVEEIEVAANNEEEYKREIEFLKKTIERQAAQINKLNETISHHLTKIDELTNGSSEEITENVTKKRKMQNVESLINTTIIEDSSNKDIEITALALENRKLKEQIEHQNKENEQDIEINRQPMRITEQLERKIEEKLAKGIESIKADLEKILQNRYAEQEEPTNSTTKHALDYSKAVQKTRYQQSPAENFRDIARMAKQEELEEENQKRLRQNNILIHGRKENERATDDSDEEFVNALLKEICVGAVKAKFMVRIGKKEDNRPRPLKVTFHNESDKIKILDNLKQLKRKSDFDGISIKDDFTISEKNLIKDYVQRANEKNQNEPVDSEYVWRVRGSPKNRLFLKKVKKENKILL